MTTLLDLLGDYTIRTVAMGAALLGLVSGALGCFAVLRRQSLLGDALSHATLPGVCLGFLLAGSREMGAILAGALVTGVLAALLVLLLVRRTRLKTDAALGIALSLFFALGVVLLSAIQGSGRASQGGLEAFLFGQAASILRGDLWLLGGVSLAALGLVLLLWKEFKIVSFDPSFAASLGLPVTAIEVALTLTMALAVVVGLQLVGVVLMAAMLIAPAVAARQWTRRLEGMVVLAALIGAASGIVGAVASALRPGLATGPLIVLAATAAVAVSLAVAPERGLLWQAIRRGAERRRLRGRRVLATLYRLAARHEDARYPSEEAMLDAYHGVATRRVMGRLEGEGLVRPVAHAPERTPHWALTPQGFAEAERDLARPGHGLGGGAA